jgi:hypothetical protein
MTQPRTQSVSPRWLDESPDACSASSRHKGVVNSATNEDDAGHDGVMLEVPGSSVVFVPRSGL